MRWVRFQRVGGSPEQEFGFLREERVSTVSRPGSIPAGAPWDLPTVIGLAPRQAGGNKSGGEGEPTVPLAEVRLLPPLEHASSFRDFYSFEEHVRRARASRGLDVPEEWYRHPTFYFSNPRCLYGPEDDIPCPRASRELDFELEVACVIGRRGRDIPAEAAAAYVAGFTLLNDWSARDVQRAEVSVGLGPAKAKDFATSLGPFLVTPDELEPRRAGKGYDVELTVRRNGRVLARGNWKTIHYSFEEMIAQASRDAWLVPGDLLGSGTVGGGSILEIGAESAGGWLGPGDAIEIAGSGLGTLTNRIVSRDAGEDRGGTLGSR
jgi:2-keto-4-pentenoate hydratase/2-oxohepta-3-ene-1,7-dioic acid hydratase in catechol pathway